MLAGYQESQRFLSHPSHETGHNGAGRVWREGGGRRHRRAWPDKSQRRRAYCAACLEGSVIRQWTKAGPRLASFLSLLLLPPLGPAAIAAAGQGVANVIELMTMPLTARLALPAILMASGCRRQKAATAETGPNKTEKTTGAIAMAATTGATATAAATTETEVYGVAKCSCNLRFVLFHHSCGNKA